MVFVGIPIIFGVLGAFKIVEVFMIGKYEMIDQRGGPISREEEKRLREMYNKPPPKFDMEAELKVFFSIIILLF